MVIILCLILEKEFEKKISKLFKGKTYPANNNTWSKEHLSPIISVKLVNNVKEAVAHINKYGTMHTDAIVTKHKNIAKWAWPVWMYVSITGVLVYLILYKIFHIKLNFTTKIILMI